MTSKLTSIIIPMLNESPSIIKTLIRCGDVDINKEIIVVDNGSTDDSYLLVSEFIQKKNLRGQVKLFGEKNKGKANAIKKGLLEAKGDYIVFHDADLEYDPKFIAPIVNALADHDIAIGCRNCRPYSISLSAFLANKIFLKLIQKKYSTNISDIFTAQRGFKRSVIDSLPLTSTRFEMETELTIRALNEHFSIKEIDVTYSPRTRNEGKKIGAKDFFSILLKFLSLSRKLLIEKKRALCQTEGI